VRATRYASTRKLSADEELWRPALDAGELKFSFILAPSGADLPRLARELQTPPLVQMVAPSPGQWSRQGTLAVLEPQHLELLAVMRDESGLKVRVRETGGESANVSLILNGQAQELGAMGAHEIKTWKV
jgi:hypothetical protein